jgi:hypothetical protein
MAVSFIVFLPAADPGGVEVREKLYIALDVVYALVGLAFTLLVGHLVISLIASFD